MDIQGRIEILVHKTKNSVIIIKYGKKKEGSLEGWFSEGVYCFSKEAFEKIGWDEIYKIMTDLSTTSAGSIVVKSSDRKKYKCVLLAICENRLRISPFEKSNIYGGAISKYGVEIDLPVDQDIFRANLEKAIKDAD